MEVLLRYLRQSPSGVTEFLDSATTVDEITIGSAADCTVQLLGRTIAGKHADIKRSGAGLAIVCRGGNRVEVNGAACASKPLAVGDKIGIAGHKLAIIQPPAGFDAAIEVRPDTTVGADEFEAAFVTDLERTWLSKRSASWTLLLVTVVLGFAIPFGMIYLHRDGKPTPVALPDDALWSSGPLSSAHAHAAGRQCDACHQDLFVHVQDPACVACHKTTQDHISKHDRLLTRLGAPQRCGECHAEHMGDATRLAIENDHLCTNCHADSDTTFGTLKVQQVKLEQVSGFEPRQHPPFLVALQQLAAPDGGRGDAQWTAYRAPLEGASEHSNLKFSHAQHLDADKVTSLSSGGALGCGDCHTLGADGEHFLPITMEKSCANCHTLNFDPSAPTRQLPHGRPLDAMLMIEDYYSHKTFDPPKEVEREPTRRLPDIERDPARRLEIDSCSGPPLQCARQRATREIENQFNGRGCVSCHVVVVDTKSSDLHDRYQVTPVKLGYNYFPDSRFPHKSHLVQGKLSGDAACETCHAARKSTVSTELLLPNVDNCLQCHRDRAGGDAVATLVTTAKLVKPAALVPTATAAPANAAPSADGAEPAAAATRKIVTLQCISCHVYHPTAISPVTHLAE
jgi:hypothetical protein